MFYKHINSCKTGAVEGRHLHYYLRQSMLYRLVFYFRFSFSRLSKAWRCSIQKCWVSWIKWCIQIKEQCWFVKNVQENFLMKFAEVCWWFHFQLKDVEMFSYIAVGYNIFFFSLFLYMKNVFLNELQRFHFITKSCVFKREFFPLLKKKYI